MPELYTERLRLRHFPEEYVDKHHDLISDPVVMRYLNDIRSSNRSQSIDNLLLAIEDMKREEHKYRFFFVEDKTTGDFIGEVGYTVEVVAPEGKRAGMGYFIHKEYWGNGYTAEAVKELTRFAFEEDGVFRIRSGCLKENRASERVMQKCGMIKEGELKSFQLHEGVLKDRLLYRLLKSEWEAMR